MAVIKGTNRSRGRSSGSKQKQARNVIRKTLSAPTTAKEGRQGTRAMFSGLNSSARKNFPSFIQSEYGTTRKAANKNLKKMAGVSLRDVKKAYRVAYRVGNRNAPKWM